MNLDALFMVIFCGFFFLLDFCCVQMSSCRGGSKRSRNAEGSSVAPRNAHAHAVRFDNTIYHGPEHESRFTSLVVRIFGSKRSLL